MSGTPVVPDPTCLRLVALEAEGERIVLTLATTPDSACCPLCQRVSDQVHSRYIRCLADLPWCGNAVRLRLHLRRFFCSYRTCPRSIFTERLPTVVAPYGRKTKRLVEVLTSIAFALGGEAGKRISQQVGCSTSGDALLHQIRVTSPPRHNTPRVLGVDDFSFRRGQRFGTILVDLERHRAIDLLPDREAETLAAWLRVHPGVKIISRDRGGSYAQGARLLAPAAIQVADRFHVLQNLRDALERFLLRQRRVLRALSPPPAHAQQQVSALVLTRLTPQEEASRQRHERFRERYEQIQDLAKKRVAPTQIAKRLGVSRQTIYKYLAMDGPPERKSSRMAAFDLLAAFRPYLLRRWNEGIRNGQRVFREVVSQGYRSSRRSVERFVGQLRQETGQPFKFRQAPAAPLYDTSQAVLSASVTALQAARLLIAKAEERTRKERALLERLRHAEVSPTAQEPPTANACCRNARVCFQLSTLAWAWAMGLPPKSGSAPLLGCRVCVGTYGSPCAKGKPIACPAPG